MRTREQLIERLRELMAARRAPYGSLFGDRPSNALLRQRIKDEEAFWRCPGCGSHLLLMKWNERVDILTCDNVHCNEYRRPGRTIPALKKELPFEGEEVAFNMADIPATLKWLASHRLLIYHSR